MKVPGKWDICILCGHTFSMHNGRAFECDVCDDPTIPIEKRCPGFESKKEDPKIIKLGY